MCLAIPGKVIEIFDEDSFTRLSKVSFNGVIKDVSLAYVPEAKIGDYVIVHVGFAISKINEEKANETLKYIDEIGEIV